MNERDVLRNCYRRWNALWKIKKQTTAPLTCRILRWGATFRTHIFHGPTIKFRDQLWWGLLPSAHFDYEADKIPVHFWGRNYCLPGSIDQGKVLRAGLPSSTCHKSISLRHAMQGHCRTSADPPRMSRIHLEWGSEDDVSLHRWTWSIIPKIRS